MSNPFTVEPEATTARKRATPRLSPLQAFLGALLDRIIEEQETWGDAVQRAMRDGATTRREYCRGVQEGLDYAFDVIAEVARRRPAPRE